MPQGQGASGAGHYPKLAGDPGLASWQFVAVTVLGGRNGMPAFGLPADGQTDRFAVQLNDQQVADVVNYVRTHFGNHYKDKATAVAVAKLPHPSPATSPNDDVACTGPPPKLLVLPGVTHDWTGPPGLTDVRARVASWFNSPAG